MQNHHKRYLAFAGLILLLAGWIFLISRINPQTILAHLGVGNAYIIIGAMAVLGGVSSFTVGPFYATLITFAAGGANIWLLSIIAGIGLTISDSVFYYLGIRGQKLLNDENQEQKTKFAHWFDRIPQWLMPIIVFGYTAFTPFPNDILTISLGLSDYPYKKFIVPLFAGDTISSFIVAFVAARGL